MTNRTVRFLVCSALGLALAGSGRAFAQDNPPAEGGTPPAAGGEAAPAVAATPAAAPAAAGNPTDITLKQGGVSIDGDIAVGMSSGNTGKPIDIVPNIYYGVTPVLSVGLAHNPGAEIFQTSGSGLCLSGTSGGCAKVYNNVSLDGLFSFSRSATMDLGAHAGLDFLQFSPDMLLSIRVGVKGKTMAGPLVIVFDPSVNIGATKRDLGNKEVLQIPVRLGFMATPQLNVGASVALVGLLDPPVGGFGDTYIVPIGLGATFDINANLAARAQFTFDNLAGKGGGADFRTFSLGAAYRM